MSVDTPYTSYVGTTEQIQVNDSLYIRKLKGISILSSSYQVFTAGVMTR